MLFMMALSVSSNFTCFWRGSMLKIFFHRRGPGGKNENEAIIFVYCDAAPQKVS